MAKKNENYVDTWSEAIRNMKRFEKKWFLKEDSERKRPFEARLVYSFNNPSEALVALYCKRDDDTKEYVIPHAEFLERFEEVEIEY